MSQEDKFIDTKNSLVQKVTANGAVSLRGDGNIVKVNCGDDCIVLQIN